MIGGVLVEKKVGDIKPEVENDKNAVFFFILNSYYKLLVN